MKKNRHIAAFAALAMVASMAAVPMSAGAETAYQTNTNGTAVITGSGNDAWLTQTVTAKDDTTITSYNATEFKKVLEIEDTANIPSVSFDYAVTVPENNVSATYEGTAVKTLAVFAGLNPELITYKYENIADNATVFKTDSSTAYVSTPSASSGKSFKITYEPQNVVLPTEGGTKKADADDNVLLYNASETEGKDGVNTYYAIKTIQMDFSKVPFTEPGIYRYYIQESGNNQGVTNDYSVTDTDKNCWRTLDVYVEDATYTDSNDSTNNKLRIAGYVMYVGKQTAGPAAGSTTVETTATAMEDGLNHTNPSGNGGANGAEVAGATKSEGIRNLYETSDITFKKTVSGNQSSKDKFFKFNIKLTAGDTANVNDNDVFIISTDSTQVVEAAYKDSTDKPNSATPYTKGAIYTANNAKTATIASQPVRYVKGSDLNTTEGYDFYLQDGQQITIQGIPNGVGYVITEYQDDYTPTVTMKKDTGYDFKNGGDTGTEITAPAITINSNINNDPQNIASITDTKILGDVEATFNNERKGTIPTGVIISIAAPVVLGIIIIGGLAFLHIQRKRRKSESK